MEEHLDTRLQIENGATKQPHVSMNNLSLYWGYRVKENQAD